VLLYLAAGRQVRSAMTSEEFRAQYQLGERLTRPPVVTHRAIDESGQPVLVHYLLGSETVSASALLGRVEATRTVAEEGEIREVTDVEGVPVVVTKVLKEFSTLQDWMSSMPDSEQPPETESEEPGAYTQFFRVSDLAAGAEERRPPSTPKDADPPRLAETPPPTPPPPPEAMTPGKPEGGDAPEREETPTSPPSDPGGEKAPGAYTMIFGKADGGVAPHESGPAKGPGSPAEPPPPAPPPAESRDAGATSETSKATSETSKATSETSEAKKSPGAYTMLFGSGIQADSGISPTAPPPPPPPEPPRSGTTLESPPTRPGRHAEEREPSEVPPPERPVQPQAPGPSPSRGSPPPSGLSQTEGIPVQPPPDVEAAPPPRPVFPRPGSPQGPPPPPPPAGAPPGAPPPPPVAEALPPPRQQPPGGEDKTETGDRKSDAPGAYTQIFGRAGAAGPPAGDSPQSWGPPTPAQRPPEPPRPSATQEEGPPEWQRWKDTPGASGRHIPSDDYLQRLGGEGGPGPTPPSTGGPGVGSLTSGPLPPSGPRPPDGPGHYTMVREGLSTDAVPPGPTRPSAKREPPPPAAAAPDFTPSRGSRLLPILGLVAILLVIVALVVVFALTS